MNYVNQVITIQDLVQGQYYSVASTTSKTVKEIDDEHIKLGLDADFDLTGIDDPRILFRNNSKYSLEICLGNKGNIVYYLATKCK